GGAGLIVVKGLLVALLAGLMLRTCWRGNTGWPALVAVVLALVALGPYLALQPVIASYLALATTLWWLERDAKRWAAEPTAERRLKDHLLLPGLFVLWANLDEWFLLGPLTVGLYLLGALVESRRGQATASAARLRFLGLVAVGGLAAGLLNPHHVH